MDTLYKVLENRQGHYSLYFKPISVKLMIT